jgi:hypothetical protein
MPIDFSEDDFSTGPSVKDGLGSSEALTFDESDFEAQQPAPLSGPEKVLGYLQKNVAPAIEGIARLPYLPYELLNKGVTAAEVGMGMKPEAAGLPDLRAPVLSPDQVKNMLYGGVPGAVVPPSQPPGDIEKGIQEFVSEAGSSMTTPENAVPLALAVKAPMALRPAVQRGVGRMFQAQMAAGVPASLQAIGQAETPSDVVKQTLGAGANILTPLAIQRGMLPRARLAAIAEAQRGAAADTRIAARIEELQKDPEVTGKTPVGTNPDGSIKFEENIKSAIKVKELETLKRLQAQKGINASQVGKTAPVHGDVRPQPESGAGEVSPEVSSPGVQPQAKPAQAPEAQQPRVLLKSEVGQQLQAGIETLKDETEFSNFSRRIMEAQRAKVISPMEASALRRQLRQQRGAAALPILTPEESGLVDAERKAIDTPIDVIDATQPGENEPFARARAGQIAGIDRANGRIWINGHEFGDWLQSDVPPERRAQAVRSVLGQERNHLATSAADAERYAGTLTAAELAIERRIYTERWGGRPDVSNTDLGFEAIRRRMDRLARMDTQEVIQAVGKERWKLKTLEALNDTIRRIRENLGTKASKEGLAILDRVQQNLDAGMVAAGGQPAALRQKLPGLGVQWDTNKPETLDALTEDQLRALLAKEKRFYDSTVKNPEGVLAKYKDDFKRNVDAYSDALKRKGSVAGTGPAALRTEQEAERIAAMTPADFVQWAKESGRGATGAGYEFAKRVGEQGRETLERYAKQQNEEMGELHAKIHATPKEDRLPMFAESAQRSARKQFFDEGIRLLDAAKSVADGMPAEMAADAHGVSVKDVRDISTQKQPEPAALRKKPYKDWEMDFFKEQNAYKRLFEELGGNARAAELFRALEQGELSQSNPTKKERAILDQAQSHFDNLTEMESEEPEFRNLYSAKLHSKEGMPRIGPGVEPAALRPKKGKEQPELYLPPTEDVPRRTSERPSAIEMGAKPFTATELDRAGYSHLENATEQALSQTEAGKAPKPPSFQAYKTALQHQFGDLQPGQLYESYSRNLYKRLLNASGPHIEAIARSLGIKAQNVAEPARARGPGLALETEGASGEAKAQIRSEQASAASRQRYRNGLVSRIADKLLKEAAPDTVATPKAVSPEDVRSPGDSKEPSFWDVSAQDLDTPNVLAQRLTQDARRSGKDPVSLTKRLTALLDKQSGRVYLVSTYPHGRAGAMLLDPSVSTLRNHRPLPDILRRFRPVSSILLDQPVKNFRQGFESLGDFESKFATDARRASQQSFPEPLSEGEQAETGSWERGEPITDAEAGAILDHVTSEVGRFEEVDDVKASLSALREDTNPQVLSAYRKLSEQLLRQNPDLSNEGLINQLAQNIYDTHKAAPDYETFVKRTMAQGGAAYQPTAEAGPEPQPSETSKELTMPIERRPPTDVRPENIPPEEAAKLGMKPAPPVPQGRPERVTSEPASLRPIKDEVERVRDMAKLLATRSSMVNDIARSLDDVDNSKNNLSRQAETRIRYASSREKATRLEKLTGFYKGNTQVLRAANAMVEAQFNRFRLPEFLAQLDQAKQNAQQMLQSQSWRERRIGKAYLRDIDASEKEVRYAQAHWSDPELQDTARKVRRSLDDQYNLEKSKGFDLTKEPGYVPHRLLGIWGGAETLFQLPRVLGTKYRLPRTFDTHYEALAAGPYMRVTHDIASLVGHRVRQGLGNIFRHEWKEGLKSIQFPDGTPMALDPIQGSKGPQSPNPAYKLIDTGGLGSIAVHEDIYKPIAGLLAPDYFDNALIPRKLLHAEQMLKHALLIGDFFHLFKMGYFGSSIIGKEVLRGGRAGWSVLDIAERDIPEAVRKGIVRPEDATWAAEQVDFGNTKISRRKLVEKFYQQMGANLGKVQDALYKDLITDLTPTAGPIRRGIARLADPSIGRYNRFLFDRFTRGLMSESVAREFERQQKAKPEADPTALMRDIAKDVNVFYGNIGRQGWFKSKTAQNFARLVGLAPQWVEGLVKKEATAYSRLSGLSSLTGQRQGVTALGTTGRAMGRAMVFMFGLTQAINLITRGKPTWQNEEEGHKLDAWIPAIGSDKEGFWLSPMAIYNEVTHDLYRIGEAKMVQGQPMMDTATQILSNKASPIARGLIVMGTGRSQTGEKITSSMGRVAEAGKAMAPLPITFGRYAQAAGHAMAPSVVPSVPPGQMQRQAFGTAGMKIEPALSKAGEMRRTASEFMRREGLKKETGWEQIQTDEPSYTKLRTAIRANDDARAANLLNELRKGRTDGEIIKSMKKHSISPFTGNTKAERLFLGSLDDRGLERYSQAREQLMGDFESFVEWYLRQPERKQ